MSKPLFVSIALVFFTLNLFAQTQDRLTSTIDDDLTIKNVAVLPVVDNVNGLYSKSLSSELVKIVDSDPQRQSKSVSADQIKSSMTPEYFISNTSEAIKILKNNKADSLLSVRLEKGSKGINIKMKLFSGSEGKLFAETEKRDLQEFSISDLTKSLSQMYSKIIAQIPYQGMVLSRDGTRVTINLGLQQGIEEGQQLSALLIVKEQRHPSFKFLVSVDKEIVGRIQITKVEENLAFGEVVLERFPNQVRQFTKVIVSDQMIDLTQAQSEKRKIGDRIESDSVYGKNAEEWYEREPSIGLMELMVGFTQGDVTNQVNGIGGVSAQKSLMPTGSLKGELWLTSEYLVSMKFLQRLGSIPNNYSGSSPSSLSLSVQNLEFDGGYQLPLVPGNYLGDRLKFLVGYVSKSVKIDDSTPTAYTSATFTGLRIGAEYDAPSLANTPYGLQVGFKYVLFPRVSESPVTSGSSSSAQIGELGIKGTYAFRKNVKWKAEILWEQNSASFSGSGTRSPGASSISYNFWHFGGGIEYLF